jgi:hypothetical protein
MTAKTEATGRYARLILRLPEEGCPALHPPRPGQHPDQLIIRHPGQALSILADHRVQHGGQQRPRRHRAGPPVLREPLQRQLPGPQAHEQALLPGLRQVIRRLAGVLRPVPRGRGQHRAVRLLAVVAVAGERVVERDVAYSRRRVTGDKENRAMARILFIASRAATL